VISDEPVAHFPRCSGYGAGVDYEVVKERKFLRLIETLVLKYTHQTVFSVRADPPARTVI
jgi:hypothetical protein